VTQHNDYEDISRKQIIILGQPQLIHIEGSHTITIVIFWKITWYAAII
jgi:hypothetical protein